MRPLFSGLAASIALLALWQTAHAAPSVSGVSGTLTSGQAVTVSGADFGAKTTAAPLKFDQFEGTVGESMVDRGWSAYGGATATVSASRAHGGTRSALSPLPAGTEAFDGAYLPLSNLTTVYSSIWFYWDRVPSGAATGGEIFKWIRISAAASPGTDPYHGVPQFRSQAQPAGAGWCYDELNPNDSLGGSGFVQTDCAIFPTRNDWTRMDVLYTLSSPPGTANGTLRTWYNGTLSMDQVGVVTRASGIADSLTSILLPQMASLAGSSSSYEFSVDDVYIDSTPARVEICNASTFAAASHCEVQPATSWAASSIVITLNRGSFGASDTAYLYVLDSSNAPNSAGFAVTFGTAGSSIDLAGNVSATSTAAGAVSTRLQAPSSLVRVPR